jgi:magnesium-transporting ATPase (P-type)
LGRNGFLLAAAIGAVAIQVLIPYVPPLADAFRATPLDLADWLLVAVVAFVPAIAAEIGRMRGRDAIWIA